MYILLRNQRRTKASTLMGQGEVVNLETADPLERAKMPSSDLFQANTASFSEHRT